MADMKVSVRFWRKSRVNAPAVFAGLQILLNDVADKVRWGL
jgi:hypothetical protein